MIFKRIGNLWIRTITVVLAVAVPLIVGISRMYRGVHYLTDIVVGIVLGPGSDPPERVTLNLAADDQAP